LKQKRHSSKEKSSNLGLLLLVIIIVIAAIWFTFYYEPVIDIKTEFPEENNSEILEETNIEEEITQDNLTIEVVNGPEDQFAESGEGHWTHMPLKFYIMNENECGLYESNKIRKGFRELQNVTDDVISFVQTYNESESDINLRCSFLDDCYVYKIHNRRVGNVIYKSYEESICAHIKGLAQITEYEGDKILKAQIEMIGLSGFSETTNKGMSGFYIGSCGHATTEIHEILHTFGFGHVNDPESIMFYSEDGVQYTLQEKGSCVGSKKEVDQIFIDKIKEIYG